MIPIYKFDFSGGNGAYIETAAAKRKFFGGQASRLGAARAPL
jgi:hypothetical protein